MVFPKKNEDKILELERVDILKLGNPFVSPSGIGMVVNVETPLIFKIENKDLVIEKNRLCQ